MIYIKKMLYARRIAREVNRAFEGETQDPDVLDLVRECTIRLPKELLKKSRGEDLTDRVPMQVYVQGAIKGLSEDLDQTVDRILNQFSNEEKSENQTDVNRFVRACREIQEISALLIDDESLAS